METSQQYHLPTCSTTIIQSTSLSSASSTSVGLLTTVAQLPHKYKIRYIIPESPLDLSIKPILCSITPPSTPSPIKKRILEIESNANALKIQQNALALDASSSNNNDKKQINNYEKILVKNEYELLSSASSTSTTSSLSPSSSLLNLPLQENRSPPPPLSPIPPIPAPINTTEINEQINYTKNNNTTPNNKPIKKCNSNTGPIKSTTIKNHQTGAPAVAAQKERKLKAVRKLKFDEDKSSPVSGTIIRSINDINLDDNNDIVQESGDIDPEYNIVEVTDEAKAELAAIPNVIGSYTCKLCRNEYDDAFCLARHRCSCIILLEYRCPECAKRFNCPANLASHRRWHKPKDELLKHKQQQQQQHDNKSQPLKINQQKQQPPCTTTTTKPNKGEQFSCSECSKSFKRQAYLRKHMTIHKNINKENTNNNNNNNNIIKTESATINNNDIIISNDIYKSDDSSNDLITTTNNNQFIKYNYDISPASAISSSSSSSSSSSLSSPPSKYRIFENSFTEAENIAATALAHLRNGPSVIRHTTTTLSF